MPSSISRAVFMSWRYPSSPLIATLSAIKGELTDSITFEVDFNDISIDKYIIDDSMIIKPSENTNEIEVLNVPNIKQFALNKK